jgi:hypothetical protein
MGLIAICGTTRAEMPASGPSLNTDAVFDPAFFPLLPWDQVHGQSPASGIDSIAACGFTLAGFVQPEDLPECERLGLKAIMAPPKIRSPFAKGGWQNLSGGDIDAYVRQMVESSKHSPAVIGYFIVDEPGALAFPALGKAVAAVRRHAPGKLAYINLFPGYATIGAPDRSQLGTESFTEYLERYVREVRPQFISYDNYMVQYSDDLANEKAASNYFRDLLEVRRVALSSKLPFWNIVSSNQIRPVTPPPSPANLLLQAYTTLAAGGRGLSWYTYYSRGYGYAAVDKQGNRTATWGYLRMVNEQVRMLGPIMNRLQSTGVFFNGPPPVETAAALTGRLVRELAASTSLRTKSDPDLPLMVGEFAGGDGSDYVMLVNLGLASSVNVRPRLQHADGKMMVISPVDGRPVPFNTEQGHWLVAGQGMLIKIARE